MNEMTEMTDSPAPETPTANDRPSQQWSLPRIAGFVVTGLSLAMGLFHLYTAGFGILEPMKQRITHLTFALVLAFLLFPPKNRKNRNMNWWDVCLALVSLVPIWHMWTDYERIVDRIEYDSNFPDFVSLQVPLALASAAQNDDTAQWCSVPAGDPAYTFSCVDETTGETSYGTPGEGPNCQ